MAGETVAVTDHYANGTYLWWHLSRPSPELVAALEEIRRTFATWRIEHLERAAVPSDTRLLDVLLVRLVSDPC
jgi:hypothetical protein